jgi:hypothetical protein
VAKQTISSQQAVLDDHTILKVGGINEFIAPFDKRQFVSRFEKPDTLLRVTIFPKALACSFNKSNLMSCLRDQKTYYRAGINCFLQILTKRKRNILSSKSGLA